MEEFALEPGEQITRAVRKHWFVLFASVLPFALLAYLPALVPNVLAFASSGNPDALGPFISLLTTDNPWVRFFLGLWWLVLWIAAFNIFTSYYLNQWIITTHRIIEIQQRGFFNREVSSVLLVRVQDVTTDIQGFFPTLLDYGTLIVQSAGANDYFKIHGIDDPRALRDLVMKEIAILHQQGQGGSGAIF